MENFGYKTHFGYFTNTAKKHWVVSLNGKIIQKTNSMNSHIQNNRLFKSEEACQKFIKQQIKN